LSDRWQRFESGDWAWVSNLGSGVLASVTKAEVLEGAGRRLAVPLGQQCVLVSASTAWKIQWLRAPVSRQQTSTSPDRGWGQKLCGSLSWSRNDHSWQMAWMEGAKNRMAWPGTSQVWIR